MHGVAPLTFRGRTKMRLPRNDFAHVAPMNLKMRKSLEIKERISRLMGRIAERAVFPVDAREGRSDTSLDAVKMRPVSCVTGLRPPNPRR